MGGAGVDARLADYRAKAQAVGIRYGFYHLLRPETAGLAQAQHALTTVQNYPAAFQIAVDVERVVGAQYPQDYPSKYDYAEQLAAFVVHVLDQTRKFPVIYTSIGEWGALMDSHLNGLFGQCPLWVANFEVDKPNLPPPWKDYWLWQYTSEGRVPGMGARDFDLNELNPNYGTGATAFNLFTPFKKYVVPAGGQFNAPRNYAFAPDKKQLHEGEDGVDGDNPQAGVVRCGRAGTIVKVGYDERGYGKYLIVDFGGGWQAWYAHFERIDVAEGKQVRVLEPLGVAGKTGNSTGVHCHLTLTNNQLGLDGYVVKKVVNPAPYLIRW